MFINFTESLRIHELFRAVYYICAYVGYDTIGGGVTGMGACHDFVRRT